VFCLDWRGAFSNFRAAGPPAGIGTVLFFLIAKRTQSWVSLSEERFCRKGSEAIIEILGEMSGNNSDE